MNRTKHILCLILLLAGSIVVARGQDQRVAFYEPAIEQQVKHHLGLKDEAALSQTQLDTITVLDLSHLGISDVRDLIHFSSLATLNLRGNLLEDVGCLYRLPALSQLDLSSNQLEEISLLSFSAADEMTVDVSWNHISDFTAFADVTSCCFTIEGIGYQQPKQDFFYSVNDLYITADKSGLPQVNYCIYSDKGGKASLTIDGIKTVSIPADESYGAVAVGVMPDHITPVIVAYDDVRPDTTYIVPPSDRLIGASETRTFRLGLPQGYKITSIYAPTGSYTAEDDSFTFTTDEAFTETDVRIAYSHYSDLRGYTTVHLVKGLLGDANCDGKVDDKDIFTLLELLMGRTPATCSRMASDLNGDGRISVADITSLVNKLH